MLKRTLSLYKKQLQLTQQQLLLVEHLENYNFTTIYAITPTYWRYVQKAELTRISQTLQLVPNIHWIVVEDSEVKTELVRNLIEESNLKVTHLNAKTPPFEKIKDRVSKFNGVIILVHNFYNRIQGGKNTEELNKEIWP